MSQPSDSPPREFFDRHPRFRETSPTAFRPSRLNLRHQALIGSNRDILQGARVLDIASHDGRWSFAALEAGARHVTGVEPRRNLVENANATLAAYGADPESYRFICGDIFEVLPRERLDVDVVLCLGFLYHTLRFPELFRRIADLNPTHLIVDTKVATDPEPVIRVLINREQVESHAVADAFSAGTNTLIGHPSVSALVQMLDLYGFDVEERYDWLALVARNPGVTVQTYQEGTRATLRFKRRSESGTEQGRPAARRFRREASGVAVGGVGRSSPGTVPGAGVPATTHRSAPPRG